MNLGFFARIGIAISDFRLYPYVVQKEKWMKAFGYFLKFILLITFILSIHGTVKVVRWMNEFLPEYKEIVHEFEIKQGELSVQKNMDTDFFCVKIYTADDKKYEEMDLRLLDLKKYRFAIVAMKDSVALGNDSFGFVLLSYKDFKADINQEGLYYKLYNMVNSNVYRGIFFCLLFIGLFLLFFVSRFLYILFVSLMLMLLGYVFKVKYHYKDYMKAAFYLITLPTIIEIIALMYVGGINDYTTITYYLLIYVYMFYVVRALKLDCILTATQQKIMSMKNESEKANHILKQEKKNKVNQEEKRKATKENNNDDSQEEKKDDNNSPS